MYLIFFVFSNYLQCMPFKKYALNIIRMFSCIQDLNPQIAKAVDYVVGFCWRLICSD